MGVAIGRLLYLWFLCPYDLVEDEAAYWEWSCRLDWSYQTKGPGIALVVRAATSLLGSTEPAIRTVAVVAGACAALGVEALARQVSRRRAPDGELAPPDNRAGYYAACVFLLMPIFQAVGLLATIDGPFVACWAIAAWAAYMSLERRAAWGWPALGAAIGIGFLFKYTILLLVPGVLVFAWIRSRHLHPSRSPGAIMVGVLLVLAGIAPVAVWNEPRGWPTVAHLLGHLRVPDADAGRTYNPMWTIGFIGSQLALVGPALVLGLTLAVRSVTARRETPVDRSGPLYLTCVAAPILMFYLLVSLKTKPEGNWAMGGYVTLAVLAGIAIPGGLQSCRSRTALWLRLPKPRPRAGFFRRRPETMEQVMWHHALAYGLCAAAVMARLDLLTSLVSSAHTGRAASLTGARVLTADAGAHAEQLRVETGREPFLIVEHYGRASILAYYLPGHPSVRCASSRMGGRTTQYDYWLDTSLDDPSLFGRPAVLIGGSSERWAPVFERVEPIGQLSGEHKSGRLAFLGYGYRGWHNGRDDALARSSDAPRPHR